MKKILIPVGIALLAGLLLMVIPLTKRFSTIQYTKDIEMATLEAQGESGWLHAREGERQTDVQGGNISRIGRLLTASEVQRELFAGTHEAQLQLTYSSGLTLSLCQEDPENDVVFISVEQNGKKRVFSLEGYRLLSGVSLAASPEGFAQTNALLEGANADD